MAGLRNGWRGGPVPPTKRTVVSGLLTLGAFWALGGCGDSPGGPAGGTAALAWGLAHQPTIEWQVVPAELAEHAGIAAQLQRIRSNPTFEWVAAQEQTISEASRLVIGLESAPECQVWLDRIGVHRDEEAWALEGVRVAAPQAGILATLRDPDRPRLPLTLACANTAENLALLLESLEPGTYPCAQLMRGEFPIMRVDLDDRGKPIPERSLACEPWFWQPGTREQVQRFSASSFTVRALAGTDRASVESYAQALRKTWQRAEVWAGPLGEGQLRLYVQGRAGHWQHSGPAGRWSRVDRASHSAQVLLPKGSGADGGAGIVEAYLRSKMGPSPWPWMADACALQASGVYEGWALEDWWAVLARLPDVGMPSDWLGPSDWERRSPHLVRPLRAMLVDLVAERDPHAVGELWHAAADHELWLDAFERAADKLGALAARSDLPEPQKWLHRGSGSGPWLGVAFDGGFDPDGAGAWSAGHQVWLQELHDLGARAIGLPLVYVAEPHGPWVRRLPWGQPDYRYAVPGETLLAAAVYEARAFGWMTAIELEVWARPSGVPLKDLVWPDVQRTNEFFDAYARASLHAALFARLHGVAALNLGNRLGEMVRTQPKDGEASLAAREPVFQARREGWRALWFPVRSVYGGLLGFGPGNAAWIQQSPLVHELDFATIEARADLRRLANPSSTKIALGRQRWEGWLDLWKSRTEGASVLLWPLGPAPPEPSDQRSPEVGIPSFSGRTEYVWMALGQALAGKSAAEWADALGVFLGPVPFDGTARFVSGQSVLTAEKVRMILEAARGEPGSD